jgi:hypothetical protein
MGAPMLRIDRRKSAMTASTASLLIGSMVYAMSQGVG